MSDEKKSILVAVIFGIIEVAFNIIAVVNSTSIILIISMLLSIVLVVTLVILYLNYKKIIDSYEFIKFLFFGSEYNGFNFFPKLKLFMDYVGKKNQVEVETIEFECMSDNNSKSSDVTWIMKNVYNRTREEIKSYCLYTTSDFGTINGVEVEVIMGNQVLKIDTDNIKTKNGIQKTPFTFVRPLKPNERIPQIRIRMKMRDAFDFSHPEIVCIYPRNYGTKVKHVEILYKTKGIQNLSVKLHGIRKAKNGYVDEPLKSCVPDNKGDYTQYAFSLDADEINVNNLYYLLISS